MRIGVAGPVSLRLLAPRVDGGANLPVGYEFAPMANWVEALLARGHEVVLFTSAPGIQQPQCYEGERLRIYIGRYRDRHRARDFFATERADLLAAMRQAECEVIHAHWTYEFSLAALDSGTPVVITAHDAPFRILRRMPNPYRMVRLAMAAQVSRRASLMTVVSAFIGTHYRKLLRFKGELRTIPNALPDHLFEATGSCRQPESVTFATVLCGWGKLKNASIALKAFQRVRNQFPQCRLLMFGPDYGKGEAAEQWALSKDLCEGVEFVGMLPQPILMDRLRHEVDVLVHPSLEESFGMAIAEAMALGLAVIAGDKTLGAVDLLQNGRVGMLVDMRSTGELAKAMLELASDPALRIHLGRSATDSARERFSVDKVFSAYESAYRDAIKLGPRGSHLSRAHSETSLREV